MNRKQFPWWLWLLPLPIVWWAALLAAGCWSTWRFSPGPLLEKLSAAMNEPLSIRWTDASLRCLLLFTMGYAVAAAAAEAGRKNRRRGEEHGSAKWGDVFQIAGRYRDRKHPGQNVCISPVISRLEWTATSINAIPTCLSSEAAGAGKSRSYAIPNVLTLRGVFAW